ncbi:D-tyrosyl-tRNA(Tyr) deacylase [Eggerthellaceae bacterium zg-997]|nr:D-tyrosyl-tRNA(Tyr) deacylase [Eggerthellaceae bacterium zg-997]
MRAVVQRVSEASVSIEGAVTGRIGRGLLVLVGMGADDTDEQAEWLWQKIMRLRIFPNDEGKTSLSLADIQGEVLIVSQFTLYANCTRGNRPSFTEAGDPQRSRALYERFVACADRDLPDVQQGEFGADMQVSLVNDGPFTICLDTHRDMRRA